MLSTWNGDAEPIDLPAPLLTVKPVAIAYKAYRAQVDKWQEAVTAAVELSKRSRQVDTEAAELALAAARKGEPIPTANLDGITAAIDAAARSEAAHLTIAQEAEQHLLDVIDEHHDDLVRAAEAHAHTVTVKLLDGIGQVLTDNWTEWKHAQLLTGSMELGKPWMDLDRPLRYRYDGHDRDLGDLLASVLRIIHRADPETEATLAQVYRFRQSPDPADYDRANELIDNLPGQVWADALGVDPL